MRHVEETPPPAPVPPHPSQSGHSGQWGLASVLLGALVVFLFPIMLATEWTCLFAIHNAAPEFIKSEHMDMGVLTAYGVVIGMFVLAGLSLLGAIVGLGYALGRGQPAGLPLGGLVVGALAAVVTLALLYGTHEGATWVREQQKLRFGPNKNLRIELVQPRQSQEG
jgi:hypothetical protein